MAINENEHDNLLQMDKSEIKLSHRRQLVSDLNDKPNEIQNEGTPIASLPVSPIGSEFIVPKPGTAIFNI